MFADSWYASGVDELEKAAADLLNCPDLNLDDLEPETRRSVERVRELLARIKSGQKRFHVRYARVVIMEADVWAEDEGSVIDQALPEVFEGLEPPSHVQEVVDYEEIWEVNSKE